MENSIRKVTSYPFDETEISQIIINACQRVMPLKVESIYVELANAVLRYVELCNQIKRDNTQSKELVRNISKTDATLKKETSEEERLKNELAKLSKIILSGNVEPDYYIKLKQLSEELYLVSKNRNVANKQEEKSKENFFVKEQVMQNTRKELADAIVQINTYLTQITLLEINGYDRLDNLAITEEHLAMFDKLDAPLEYKELLKNAFVSFIHLRIAAFKVISNQATTIFNAYQNRQLFTDLDNETIDQTRIALLGLSTLNLGGSSIANPGFKYYQDYLEKCTSAINVIEKYLATGELDLEEIEEAFEHINISSYAEIERMLNTACYNRKQANSVSR